MEIDILPPQPDSGLLDLGEMLGRHNTFAALAGRCSASQAACLRKIRDERSYRATGLGWRQFCSQRLGMARAHADQLIRNLNEFGPAYFELAQIVRISPATFRKIAGAVSPEGLAIEGEIVPIRPENAQRISDAVEALRGKPCKPEKPGLQAAGAKLEASLALIGELVDLNLAGEGRERLQDLIAYGLQQLMVFSKLSE